MPSYPDVVSRIPSAVRVLTLTVEARKWLGEITPLRAVAECLLAQRECATVQCVLFKRHCESHDQLQDSVASELGSELVDLLRESLAFRDSVFEVVCDKLDAVAKAIGAMKPTLGRDLDEYMTLTQSVRWIIKIAQKLFTPGKIDGPWPPSRGEPVANEESDAERWAVLIKNALQLLAAWSAMRFPHAAAHEEAWTEQEIYADELRRSTGQSQLKLFRLLAQFHCPKIVELTATLFVLVGTNRDSTATLNEGRAELEDLNQRSWLTMVLAETLRSEAKAIEVDDLCCVHRATEAIDARVKRLGQAVRLLHRKFTVSFGFNSHSQADIRRRGGVSSLRAQFDDEEAFLAYVLRVDRQNRWCVATLQWDAYAALHRTTPTFGPPEWELSLGRPSFEVGDTKLILSGLSERSPLAPLGSARQRGRPLLPADVEERIRAYRTNVECVVLFLNSQDAASAQLSRAERRESAKLENGTRLGMGQLELLRAATCGLGDFVAHTFRVLGDQVQEMIMGEPGAVVDLPEKVKPEVKRSGGGGGESTGNAPSSSASTSVPLSGSALILNGEERGYGIACFCLSSFTFALETSLLNVVDNTIKLPVLTSLVHDGGLTAVLSAARCIAGCELRPDAWNGVREAMALATAKVMDLVAAACGSMSDEYPTEMDEAMDEASAEIARGTLLRATHSVLRTSLAPYVTGAVSLDRLPVFGFVQALRRVIQQNDDLLDDQVKYVDGSPGATLEALTCSLSGFLTDFVGFGFGTEAALQMIDTCRAAAASEPMDVQLAPGGRAASSRKCVRYASPPKDAELRSLLDTQTWNSPSYTPQTGTPLPDDAHTDVDAASAETDYGRVVNRALNIMAERLPMLIFRILGTRTLPVSQHELSECAHLLSVVALSRRLPRGWTIHGAWLAAIVGDIESVASYAALKHRAVGLRNAALVLNDLLHRFWPRSHVDELALRAEVQPLIAKLVRFLVEYASEDAARSVARDASAWKGWAGWVEPALILIMRFMQTSVVRTQIAPGKYSETVRVEITGGDATGVAAANESLYVSCAGMISHVSLRLSRRLVVG